MGFVFVCTARKAKSGKGYVFEIGNVTYFINTQSGIVSEITGNAISDERKRKNQFILQGGNYRG
jgi:hypothetical protein